MFFEVSVRSFLFTEAIIAISLLSSFCVSGMEQVFSAAESSSPSYMNSIIGGIGRYVSSFAAQVPDARNVAAQGEVPKDGCGICLNVTITNGNGIDDTTHLAVKVSTLPCNHAFCTQCIIKWAATKPACPLCRATVPNNIVVAGKLQEHRDMREKVGYVLPITAMLSSMLSAASIGACISNVIQFYRDNPDLIVTFMIIGLLSPNKYHVLYFASAYLLGKLSLYINGHILEPIGYVIIAGIFLAIAGIAWKFSIVRSGIAIPEEAIESIASVMLRGRMMALILCSFIAGCYGLPFKDHLVNTFNKWRDLFNIKNPLSDNEQEVVAEDKEDAPSKKELLGVA